VRTLKYVGLIH